MNILVPDKVPVLIAGMWPANHNDPESGARIFIHERVGEPELLSGFSDEFGEFRGHLTNAIVGKTVRIVILEPSFKYDSYNSVVVERWGLFLPVRAQKDHNYNGSKGAKSIDYERWHNWKEAEEFSAASRKTHNAARLAKVAWPLGYVGVFAAAVVGAITIPLNPLVGVVISILAAVGLNWLGRIILLRGY